MGSAQHGLTNLLVALLHPVLQYYSEYCIPDSFQSASYIHKLQRTVYMEFLVSFGICSLIMNVPPDKTIDICSDYLYRGHLKPPFFPECVFVSFSLDNYIYQHIDSVAMGSPL